MHSPEALQYCTVLYRRDVEAFEASYCTRSDILSYNVVQAAGLQDHEGDMRISIIKGYRGFR